MDVHASDFETYVGLNGRTRHDLIVDCIYARRRASWLDTQRSAVSSALYAYLNDGLPAEDALNRIRKALYPSWVPQDLVNTGPEL